MPLFSVPPVRMQLEGHPAPPMPPTAVLPEKLVLLKIAVAPLATKTAPPAPSPPPLPEPPVVVKFSRVALLTVSVPLATKYPGALLPLIVPLMVVSLVMRVCAEAGTADPTREQAIRPDPTSAINTPLLRTRPPRPGQRRRTALHD